MEMLKIELFIIYEDGIIFETPLYDRVNKQTVEENSVSCVRIIKCFYAMRIFRY